MTRSPGASTEVHSPGATFRRVAAADVERLAAFFARLEAAGDTRHFHPHPMTQAEAQRICVSRGLDYFCIALRGDDVVAYGMLRGWDAGFAVPSLGIALDSSVRGTGLAQALLTHLHDVARARGSQQVRLKVHPDNEPALRLYRAAGYRVVGEEDGQLVALRDVAARG